MFDGHGKFAFQRLWGLFLECPLLVLEYEANDDLLFYGSYSQGFKSGGFSLSANLAFLDADIQEGTISAVSSATPPISIGAPLPIISEDAAGNNLTRAPDFSGYVNLAYEKPIGAWLGRFDASVKHQSSVFFLETNQDSSTFRNQAWEEVDLRFTLLNPNASWELSVFGQNVFDNRHITAVTAFGGFPNAAVNEPVKWGVEAVVRY